MEINDINTFFVHTNLLPERMNVAGGDKFVGQSISRRLMFQMLMSPMSQQAYTRFLYFRTPINNNARANSARKVSMERTFFKVTWPHTVTLNLANMIFVVRRLPGMMISKPTWPPTWALIRTRNIFDRKFTRKTYL